jgi:hypothetical protein
LYFLIRTRKALRVKYSAKLSDSRLSDLTILPLVSLIRGNKIVWTLNIYVGCRYLLGIWKLLRKIIFRQREGEIFGIVIWHLH